MIVGRFAPSPTGPLHFGSLVAAVASYCDAKSRGGKWLLRIEDVDQTRKMAGASEEIIHTLEHYGFVWDDEITYQSQRTALYEVALNRLRDKYLAYPCTCSRKEIADSSSMHGIEGVIYPGTCLSHPIKHDSTAAWRLKTTESLISFQDLVQGRIQHNMAREIGDFVIKRSDGLYSYQLAVVVDDALQGVTHVVRGADLLNSTTRQIYLQQLLGYPTPVYAHIPLVLNADGQKLSKQTLAESLPKDEVIATLLKAFRFLPNFPTHPQAFKTLPDLWQWALDNWQPLDSIR
ncbi:MULTISPECIES: tRNA glutamyl-Q(34) synthetase GluQRS [unclassified Methylophilus]|uniref:tRNA glutamyl-Q(34) synthetase GluQRS n=1 Tax=unclassified Methylophilus TaxID=2630143 RepID=UPI0006F75C02|nr:MULTISPECIES: tRNA glutamyl-Q(34) synthetase GluQRS [unclassified Methylophilus]KQT41754.1 glutamyl-Q tRNA(Asp) ligase [Methylophilus sp. Leaf416]KQT55921.1 glutamyl-Q tRNA(Asp) ligase [Methylophilus sp. Leaf459]